ncbi:MAG: imelysin family protein [Breznakibacter sp.]
MNRLVKTTYCLFAIALLAGTFVACSDNGDDSDESEKETMLSEAIEQYVDNTVIATYKDLADASIGLYNAIAALKADPTDANMQIAADQWVSARASWELSEAFLYGAVADFGIDPHIDTWPLDETAFNYTINNTGYINSMADEDGDIWVSEHLGAALLGFHGIEYILFKDSNVKSANNVTTNELIYALAVAGDLRNQCIRLEAAWAGVDAVSNAKQQIIEDKELEVSLSNSEFTYGEIMTKAGQAGSSYRSITSAANAILDGCTVISDEVGNVKLGNAHRGDDVNYLESPYSWNSLVDFKNNIISIENAYLGGADENSRGASVSDYIKSVNATADTKVKEAIANAIEKIEAITYPFEKNYATSAVGDAIDACDELTEVLNAAKTVLTSN